MNENEKIIKIIKEIRERQDFFFEQKMFYLDHNFFEEADKSEAVISELIRICNILRAEFKI